jgi:hypothetical protein
MRGRGRNGAALEGRSANPVPKALRTRQKFFFFWLNFSIDNDDIMVE